MNETGEKHPKILWLDNDPGYLGPFKRALERRGSNVELVSTISVAERLLTSQRFDLLILDAMIPVRAGEQDIYSASVTERGHATGVAFYRNWSERLMATNTKVLVFTIRADSAICENFEAAGLPQGRCVPKVSLREPRDFCKKVFDTLGVEEGTADDGR